MSAADRAEKEKAEKEKVWTVLELLRWTTEHFTKLGLETPRLDAECLLAHALGGDRLRLYVDFDKPVLAAERAPFRELVKRRAQDRVPVAQLTGRKEFWSLPLAVTADVLSPRPDTEVLVGAALEALADPDAEARVLDIGTGSGAVALAIAKERPKARVIATDISAAALAVAAANAETLGLTDRVRFLEGDLFAPVADERFDVVLSNPPYVAERDRPSLAPELAHEPEQALFSGPDGLAALKALCAGVGAVLAPGGFAAFEIGADQAGPVSDWCRGAGLLDVTVHRDLEQRPRVVSARAAGEASGEGGAGDGERGALVPNTRAPRGGS